jgi:ferredoxin
MLRPNGDQREESMADAQLMVWIDQDLCTGDGICEEIAPDVFQGRDDGLWVVKETAGNWGADIVFDGTEAPDGARGVARVPNDQIDITVEAAEECPGECIMIEPFDQETFAKRGA